MRKIFFLFFIFSISVKAQNNDTLYINSDFTMIDLKEYMEIQNFRIWFKVENKDFPRNWDVYQFHLGQEDGNKKIGDFEKLGNVLETNRALEIKDWKFFRNKDVCNIHNLLSFKTIFFVKKLRFEKKKYRYIVWQAVYSGTVMNEKFENSYKLKEILAKK